MRVSIWGVELSADEVWEVYSGLDAWIRNDVYGPGELARHTRYSDLVSWWRMGDSGDTVGSGVISKILDRKGTNDMDESGSPTTTTGPTAGRGDIAVTASVNDNAFVSHMIPRSDYQTSWITASLI
jgi:hypothetical protein